MLYVKGGSAAQQYWRKREKTKATMQGEWINTGDKYYVDYDGFLLVRRPGRRHVESGRYLGITCGGRELHYGTSGCF